MIINNHNIMIINNNNIMIINNHKFIIINNNKIIINSNNMINKVTIKHKIMVKRKLKNNKIKFTTIIYKNYLINNLNYTINNNL
jgi:hypothetical protein